jgi:hypothetical protein
MKGLIQVMPNMGFRQLFARWKSEDWRRTIFRRVWELAS